MNRPWCIWWDFQWNQTLTKIKSIVVQTDHPQYSDIDYIYKFPIEECVNSDGAIDDWEEIWFRPFQDDVTSGRTSIHTIMKEFGHTKGERP